MRRTLAMVATLFVALAPASAVTITFDENSLPTNPVNGFGSFAFDDFGVSGAVTESAEGIVLDVVDSNSSNGVFGGVGVDYVLEDPPGSGTFVPQDFDPATHQFELNIKLLPNNGATGINAAIIDDDGAGTADDHQFNFDLTGVPDDGEFHLLTASLLTPGFTQGAFGFSAGDGVVNPGLRQIQLQGQFGSTGRLNVEVDFLRIAPIIPEPSSAVLLCLGMVALGRRS